MQKNLHPVYKETKVHCTTCDSNYQVLSLKSEIKIDVCSNCHQFYIGKSQFKRSASRVEKFNKKYNR